MTTVLLLVIYITFIGLGLPDSLLGSAWPIMHLDLGVPIGLAGMASIVATGGTVISSLLSEGFIKRFGTGAVTTVSVALTATALIGIRFTSSFVPVLLLSIPLGLGGGTVDSALNNYVALHYKSTHMNWLHCFWGIGASCGPLIMSSFLAQDNWRGAYQTISLLLCCIVAMLVCSLKLWRKLGGPTAVNEADTKPVPKKTLLKLPGAVLACLSFACYCGVEYTAGLWASSFFVEAKGISADKAASWASLYYVGITLGRGISGFLAMKLKDRQIIRIGLTLMGVGAALLILPIPGLPPVAGLVLLGLGSAPIFPGLLDLTPEMFGETYSQGMIGLQMAFAYMGGSLLSPLFGLLSSHVGLELWPWYLLTLFILLLITSEGTRRAASRK